MICINKNSVEYQLLKERANINETVLEAMCRYYVENYGRFPYLDELPDSNSIKYLREKLKITSNDGANINDILELSNASSIEEANASLNNIYRDTEIEITPITERAIVDIKPRPTKYNSITNRVEVDPTPNSRMILENTIRKLSSLYGINFKIITDLELASEKWKGLMPETKLVNAFVFNGDIYINVDRADVDAPIHELFHILLGSIRFTDPNTYSKLIKLAEQLPNYRELASQYKDRTRNDINEEIMISEVSKYIMGLPSALTNIDQKLLYEISYSIHRVLDSALMGDNSSSTVSEQRLFNMSLKNLVRTVNSSIMTNHTIRTADASLHRRINNTKKDLIANGSIKEVCG